MLLRVISTLGVEELPQGDKTSRVTPKGDSVPGAVGRGQVGDRKSPATRDTEVSGDSSSGRDMASGLGPAPPPIPQQNMAAGSSSKVSMHRHPNGARPKHGALARRK